MIACGVAITSKGRSPWLSCVRRTARQDTTRSQGRSSVANEQQSESTHLSHRPKGLWKGVISALSVSLTREPISIWKKISEYADDVDFLAQLPR